MRVEIALRLGPADEPLEIPGRGTGPDSPSFDLRDDPAALAHIEPARRHRPLHDFLAAVNSADSLFATVCSKVWLNPDDPAGGELCSEFASRVGVAFAREGANFDRGSYEDLARGLAELLAAESGDTSRAELHVHRGLYGRPGRSGFALIVLLFSRGATAGQAELRWGFALTRLQQAFLFLSRVLRQRQAQSG